MATDEVKPSETRDRHGRCLGCGLKDYHQDVNGQRCPYAPPVPAGAANHCPVCHSLSKAERLCISLKHPKVVCPHPWHDVTELVPPVPAGGEPPEDSMPETSCGQPERDAEILAALEPAVIYYGPHPCERCSRTICKASREQGGIEFDYPQGPIYPNTNWVRHECPPEPPGRVIIPQVGYVPPSAQPDAETKPDLHSYEAPWGRPEDWPDLPSPKADSPSPGAREWMQAQLDANTKLPWPVVDVNGIIAWMGAYAREREQRVAELEAGLALCESDAGFIADAADAGAYSRNLACKMAKRVAALRALMMRLCPLCGHSLEDNQHGFDQNDASMDGDKLVHCGRCTYCRVCNPGIFVVCS